MHVSARPATADDLDALTYMYREAEEEQTALKAMWPLADGLAEPVEASLKDALADGDTLVVIGEIDGYPFGFALAVIQDLLPQAGGEQVGSIRMMFTEEPAREAGVGEAMAGLLLDLLRERGLRRFDAHVLPGHRLAKNFFEANGFAARSIIMYHEDE